MPWLLNFTPGIPGGGAGRPWADGTQMAQRAATGGNPWDTGCRVTPYPSAMDAMTAMVNDLEAVIAAANAAAAPIGQRGHVYIADWRFNCMRDLSTGNAWGTGPWAHGQQANLDQTAIGLVVRLLQAGVMVRMMLWLPTRVQQGIIGPAHIADHFLAAKIVQYESNRIAAAAAVPLGIVALDTRTGGITIPAASHHQKMMVIRSPLTVPPTDVAFVGGVDLAYTRRSAPNLTAGDWQSGNSNPNPAQWWPPQAAGVNYGFQAPVPPPVPAPVPPLVPAMTTTQGTDLPPTVYGDSATPATRQMWHDQHLKLEGPIVETIEHQFGERWVDQPGLRWVRGIPPHQVPALSDLTDAGNWTSGQVIFSTANAYLGGAINPLPAVAPVAPVAVPGSTVQMWRTIPLRTRTQAPFQQGEFTVMAGIANAVQQSAELILMFDQYFWSQPLARLLNARLQAVAGLHLILILPPYADASEGDQHLARKAALQVLTAGGAVVANKVGVYNMWDGNPGRGIYVHAKSHTYDDQLLVCGSANLNRRSFLCDTELACAVEDPAVVTAHQQALWAELFPGGAAWPAILYAPGWGGQFFTQFQAAAGGANSLLIDDPWDQVPPTLPNNVVRPVALFFGPGYATGIDPSSVRLDIEKFPVPGSWFAKRDGNLAEIVTRLENTPGNNNTWPWRQW